MTDDAIQWIGSQKDKAFAMTIHFREPHLAYKPVPKEDSALFEKLDPTVPQLKGLDIDQIKGWTRDYYAAIAQVLGVPLRLHTVPSAVFGRHVATPTQFNWHRPYSSAKVQQLLGHKSPIMTQRYAHHYPESLRDGVEILDRLRDSSTKVAQSAGHDPGVNCVSI